MTAMDNTAYDISHLLALDFDLPDTGKSAARSAQPMRAAVKKPPQLSVAEAQAALSRELMRTAEIHDALVQQYLHTTGNPFQDK